MAARINYKEGQKFKGTRLTYLYDDADIYSGSRYFRTAKFQCDCGKEKTIRISDVRSLKTKSCGCLCYVSESLKHGYSKHRLYGTWIGMVARCHNINDNAYLDYGGRGIKVCSAWKNNIEKFITWAEANGYKKGLSIERKNNSKGYSPSNCIWASRKTQQRNTRDSRIWYVYGKRYDAAIDAAKKHKVNKTTIHSWCNGRTMPDGRYYPPKHNCWSKPKYEK